MMNPSFETQFFVIFWTGLVTSFTPAMTFQVPWMLFVIEGGMTTCLVLRYERVVGMRRPHPSVWCAAKASPVRQWTGPLPAEAATREMVVWQAGASTVLLLPWINCVPSPLMLPQTKQCLPQHTEVVVVPFRIPRAAYKIYLCTFAICCFGSLVIETSFFFERSPTQTRTGQGLRFTPPPLYLNTILLDFFLSPETG